MSIQAVAPPPLEIPQSTVWVTVRIIDTGARIDAPAHLFLEPSYPGHEILAGVPAFPFLIEHASGRKVIFNLGIRKDWGSFAPAMLKQWYTAGFQCRGDEDVVDVLEKGGVRKEEIDSVTWSHWHGDHVGDTSRFSSDTELIVGPGFSNALLPGYPQNKDSLLLETDYDNRPFREIDLAKEGTHKLGRFDALDYFGDGSFYLLNAPGIFMGGDACHYCGEFRPTKYLPLPKELSPSPFSDPPFAPGTTCPGSLLQSINTINSATSEPFYKATVEEQSKLQDHLETLRTTEKMTEFDANENILTIIDHDASLLNVLEFYPASANLWKEKGWRPAGLWRFLVDFKGAVVAAGA